MEGGDGLSKKDTQKRKKGVEFDESVSTRDETRRFLSLHFRAFSTVVCTTTYTHGYGTYGGPAATLVCIQTEVA